MPDETKLLDEQDSINMMMAVMGILIYEAGGTLLIPDASKYDGINISFNIMYNKEHDALVCKLAEEEEIVQ